MAIKRPKFLRVVMAPLPRASTDIPGIRRKDDVLPVGSIVPVEWFDDTPDNVFVFLMNPTAEGGIAVLVEHQPEVKEMMLLREQYPDVFAKRDNVGSPTQALTPDPSSSGRGEKSSTRSKKSSDEDGE